MKCIPPLLLAAALTACSSGTSDAAGPETPPTETPSTDAPPAEDAAPNDAETAGVYTVDAYDPARNPSADLEATVARAGEEQKRILLEIGGDW